MEFQFTILWFWGNPTRRSFVPMNSARFCGDIFLQVFLTSQLLARYSSRRPFLCRKCKNTTSPWINGRNRLFSGTSKKWFPESSILEIVRKLCVVRLARRDKPQPLGEVLFGRITLLFGLLGLLYKSCLHIVPRAGTQSCKGTSHPLVALIGHG